MVLYDIGFSHSVPFVELENHTNFVDKDRVLFSKRVIFRIEETYEEYQNLWAVKLTLSTGKDYQ